MGEKLYNVREGCPLCKSDVIGNKEIKYYCKGCNILFSEEVIVERDLFAGYKE